MKIQPSRVKTAKVLTDSSRETLKLGRGFGRLLRGGEVIGLTGDLGSGKTVFAKGVALGLGVKDRVSSPSFTLMKSYPLKRGAKLLLHFDLYRVKKVNELKEVGFAQAVEDEKNIVLVEWPEKAKGLFPKNAVEIKFGPGKKPKQRIIEFKSWTKRP
jgi:tRNA threonylcarbamoyladenosine biosynthesis protein TsaE